jgi:hypothetical protein
MSDAHWAATIKATTRFGEGDIKTIAKGNANVFKDLQDIFAGQANLENGQIVAPSGRTYGYHPETGNVYLTGGPGTVTLTRAEFSVYTKMRGSGGLKDDALKFFNGMQKANNAGLSESSQQKLMDLYNSANYKP